MKNRTKEFRLNNKSLAGHGGTRLPPVIPALWEAQTRGSQVQAPPEQLSDSVRLCRKVKVNKKLEICNSG